jgi:hypothetical protein
VIHGISHPVRPPLLPISRQRNRAGIEEIVNFA